MKKTTTTGVPATDSRKAQFRPALSVSHESMLVAGDDEAFRHVLFLSRMFADRLATFRDMVAKQIDLSGNQYAIFLAIAHSQKDCGVTVREVAHYALMASTHVTTQVGALIRKGLVQKKPNKEDGRSVLLSLTQKGEKAMEQIAPMRREFNDAFFVHVSRSSLLAVSKFFEQVTANTENALPLLEEAERKLAARVRTS
jgi:MarR family transcriptional regulator, organic hydroperoxide resistance regulator